MIVTANFNNASRMSCRLLKRSVTSATIAPRIGCVPQMLNEWVRRAGVDAGVPERVTSSESQRASEFMSASMRAHHGIGCDTGGSNSLTAVTSASVRQIGR